MPIVTTGALTIVDVNDGGAAYLTNDSTILTATNAGVVSSFTGAETQFRITEGGADTTNDWSYYVSGTGGGISYRDSDDAADRTATGMAAGALGGSNLISWSEYNAATWSLPYAGPTLTTGIADPYGGTDAVRITMSGLSGLSVSFPSFTANGTAAYTLSFWCRLVNGSGSFAASVQGAAFGSSYASQLASGSWTRVVITAVPSAGSKTYIELISGMSVTATLDFFGVQLEQSVSASALVRTAGSVASGTRGFVKVAALSQDLSYLDITAIKSPGTTFTRRFSVAKARAGASGTNGTNGANGVRGTIVTSRAITGSSWSDAEAVSAISAAGGGTPLQNDVVTLYNSGVAFSQTRVYTASNTWSPLAGYFGGDVLVNGTLTADKIISEGITKTYSQIGSNVYFPTGQWNNIAAMSVVCNAGAKRTILVNCEFADETAFGVPTGSPSAFQGNLRLAINGTPTVYDVDTYCWNGTTTALTWVFLDTTSRSGTVTFTLQGKVDNFPGATRNTSGYRDPTITILEHIR